MLLTKESIDPLVLCNVLAPIFICGFLGNIICITVFLRRRFRTRSISVYFIALFFNDCLLLFISHVGKMLIFDASSSCWFNVYLSKFIEFIRYRDLIYHGGLSVLTYNTTYSQISMLIFMFMSIQRVRTFSSISYRESRMCAFMLTIIAFIYGLIVSYMQLYDAFCIQKLNLNSNQTLQIDSLMNETQQIMNEICIRSETNHNLTAFQNVSVLPWNSYSTFVVNNASMNNYRDPQCQLDIDWQRMRHRTVAYVYLQSYMSIDWPDEHAKPSECALEDTLPNYLLNAINNITQSQLQSRPGKDHFLEHQFCTQTFHYIDAYANCSWPLSPEKFQNVYQFLYDRRLSLNNRYTIGFIIGTFIPSSICILSSLICLYYISNRPLIRKHSHSRAELRSLSLIFVEIILSLMSALQSYMINFFTCHRLLFRMQSDNCYGESSNNILPNFLGSILELFTSTSNIIILMICGSQFRNEVIEILHLKRFYRSKQQQTGASRDDQSKTGQAATKPGSSPVKKPPVPSLNRLRKSARNSRDASMDSLLAAYQNKENANVNHIEQSCQETTQCLMKLTAV